MAAAASYAQCSDQGAKNTCRNRLGKKAGEAAVRAVNLNNCDEARKILAAAQQMGVNPASLAKGQAAVASCK